VVREQFLKALCAKAAGLKSRPLAIAIAIAIGIEPDGDFDFD